MTTINTKKVANRREIKLATLDDLAADTKQIAQADAQGRAKAMGNWSPGQNLQHLARFITCSLDGFDKALPFGIRAFGWILRRFLGKKLFKNPVPPGYTLPVGTPFIPADDVSVADASAELLAVLDRIRAGAAFVPKSPFFGPLTREQWIELHLRHAELHLSFVGIDA